MWTIAVSVNRPHNNEQHRTIVLFEAKKRFLFLSPAGMDEHGERRAKETLRQVRYKDIQRKERRLQRATLRVGIDISPQGIHVSMLRNKIRLTT